MERRFEAAPRGFFFVVVDPDLVGDGAAWRGRVREIIDESLTLPPMRGTEQAALPGTLEWRREHEHKEMGIPLPDDHREMLDAVAADLSIGPPA